MRTRMVRIVKCAHRMDSDWAYLGAGVISLLHGYFGAYAAVILPVVMLLVHHYITD